MLDHVFLKLINNFWEDTNFSCSKIAYTTKSKRQWGIWRYHLNRRPAWQVDQKSTSHSKPRLPLKKAKHDQQIVMLTKAVALKKHSRIAAVKILTHQWIRIDNTRQNKFRRRAVNFKVQSMGSQLILTSLVKGKFLIMRGVQTEISFTVMKNRILVKYRIMK